VRLRCLGRADEAVWIGQNVGRRAGRQDFQRQDGRLSAPGFPVGEETAINGGLDVASSGFGVDTQLRPHLVAGDHHLAR
jgi:hypothetical protein